MISSISHLSVAVFASQTMMILYDKGYYQAPFARDMVNLTKSVGCFMLDGQTGFSGFVLVSLHLVLFLLGSVLPDVDSRRSLLGRFVYVSVEHRTWTHALWFPTVFVGLGIWVHSLWFSLGLGYWCHLLQDNLSKGGVCFLYPLTDYQRFGNSQAKVKKRHLWLYKVGGRSETVLVFVFALTGVLAFFGWLFALRLT